MQIFYVAMAVGSILTAGLFQLEEGGTAPGLTPQVIAEQMSFWHRRTYDRCVEDGCESGSVEPKGHASEVLEFGDGDGTGNFVSLYDESTRTLETRIRNVSALAGDMSSGLISSALQSADPYQAVRSQSQIAPHTAHSDGFGENGGDSIGYPSPAPLHPEPVSIGSNGPVIVSVLPE